MPAHSALRASSRLPWDRLLPVKSAAATVRNPLALTTRLAERLPAEKDDFGRQSALLLLLAGLCPADLGSEVTGTYPRPRQQAVGRVIADIGWVYQDSPAPIPPVEISRAATTTTALLHGPGLVTPATAGADELSDDGRRFVAQALRG